MTLVIVEILHHLHQCMHHVAGLSKILRPQDWHINDSQQAASQVLPLICGYLFIFDLLIRIPGAAPAEAPTPAARQQFNIGAGCIVRLEFGAVPEGLTYRALKDLLPSKEDGLRFVEFHTVRTLLNLVFGSQLRRIYVMPHQTGVGGRKHRKQTADVRPRLWVSSSIHHSVLQKDSQSL